MTNDINHTDDCIMQGVCPACGEPLQPDSGCWFCPACGWSACEK